MIEKCAPLLSDDVIKRAEKLGVALLLDGVKKAKIDIPNGGCMDADVMPVDRGMCVVGTAAYRRNQVMEDNFPIHVAELQF